MDRKKLNETLNIILSILLIILVSFYLGYALYAVFVRDKITASADTSADKLFPAWTECTGEIINDDVYPVQYQIGTTFDNGEYFRPYFIYYNAYLGNGYQPYVVNISSADIFNSFTNIGTALTPKFKFLLPIDYYGWGYTAYATLYVYRTIGMNDTFNWYFYLYYPEGFTFSKVYYYGDVVSLVSWTSDFTADSDIIADYEQGYSDGLVDNISIGEAYSEGYSEGISMGGALGGFFPSIFSAVSDFFVDTLGGMTLFGISAWQVVLTLVSIGLVILIGKIFIK